MSDCRLWTASPPAQVPQTGCFVAATGGCSKYREWTAGWMRWASDLCAIPEGSRHTEYMRPYLCIV